MGSAGDIGDGGAAAAAEVTPVSLAIDQSGNLFISESEERVRKVLAQPPPFDLSAETLRFAASAGGAPAPPQVILAKSTITGVAFTVESRGAQGWLKVDPVAGATPRQIQVFADPGDLPPGDYQATMVVTAPLASVTERRVDVRFTVTDPLPPRLGVDRNNLSFAFPRSGRLRRDSLVISNTGGGTLDFTVSAETESGGNWLSVSPEAGRVTPRNPVLLSVTANPAGLTTGTYRGTIAIGDGRIPVTLTVSDVETAILLTQTGLSFTTVAGGGVAPPQEFGVLNIGNGTMNWTVTTSTLSGGPAWLRATAAASSTDAAADTVPVVAVTVDQRGLTSGRHYGLVRVDAPGAANTPQVVSVFLEVLAPGSNPGAVVQPAELVFSGAVGSGTESQDVFLYNLSAAPVTFRSRFGGGVLLDHGPKDATVLPERPVRAVVQVRRTEIASASTVLSFQFNDGTVRNVNVRSLVSASGPAPLSSPVSRRTADGCTPTALVPSFLTLGQASTVSPGWPAGIVADVKDDCGRPLATGSVLVSFTNGDAPLALVSLKDGRWHGTWQSRNAELRRVTVKLSAEEPQQGLRGERELAADLSSSQDPPVVGLDGIVSAATPVPHVPLGPGSMISVFGERLTEGLTETAGATPLQDRLAGAEVIMAGRRLPLLFASPGQINAIVPYDLTVNTTHQVLIRRALTYSRPVSVNVAPAQPAVFQRDGLSIVVAVRGTRQFVVTPDSPAQPGDTLIIYCAGLGRVDPAVIEGTTSPLAPLSGTSQPVTVQIGGVSAPVAFAGLTPGSTGLYQVNTQLPDIVPEGASVPLIIEVAGQRSPPVSLAIQR
jgi:uncharacterized protein (TIGR03437 family)